jgi:hypothetical protein
MPLDSLCPDTLFPSPSCSVTHFSSQDLSLLLLLLLLLLFRVYLTTLFQYFRTYSVDLGGKTAASVQFPLNPDSSIRLLEPETSSSEAGETWVRNMAAEFSYEASISCS